MKLKYSKYKPKICELPNTTYISPPKKTILQRILSPFIPVKISSLESESTTVSMPCISGPPEVKPIPILKRRMPVIQDEPILELYVPEISIPGPEPGSREWRKQQFKLTNFI